MALQSKVILKIENINIFDTGPFFLCLKQKEINNSIDISLFYKSLKDNITKESIKTVNKTLNKNTFTLTTVNDDLKIIVGQTKSAINGSGNDDLKFLGEILDLKLWNNIDLSLNEIYSHSNNINSLGIDTFSNERLNEKLRLRFSAKEIDDSFTFNSSDNFIILNLEKSNIDNNFAKIYNKQFNSLESFFVINKTEVIKYFYKSLLIDKPIKQNKVDIISFEKEQNKKEQNNYNEYPSFSVPGYFEYNSENEISIEMSVVRLLNEDIEKIISDIESFANIFNKNQAIYSKDYFNLKSLREEYFSKYSEKDYLNYSSLGNIFKFFDNIMSELLEDLISSKIKFNGFNLVFESHVLERNKYEHKNGYSNVSIVESDDIQSYSREIIKKQRPDVYNRNRRDTSLE